jgi:hypothetical protein
MFKHDVIYFYFRTLGQRDRFADVSKMIGYLMTGILAGDFCLIDNSVQNCAIV